MKIEYIRGDYNSSCLAIGGKRITDGKLLGVGYSVCTFDADVKPGDVVEIYKGELFVNGEPTQGVLTKEELEEHIKEVEKRRKRFVKDIKHKHNWELCNREKWTIEYMYPCEYCEHSEHCYAKLTDGCDKTIAYIHDLDLSETTPLTKYFEKMIGLELTPSEDPDLPKGIIHNLNYNY